MASNITITVGSTIASRIFSNDAKVGITINKFYDAYSLGPSSASNQQKLLAVIDWFIRTMVDRTVQQYAEEQRIDAETDAKGIYGIE